MKNNFRTLISGILVKASTLFPKKEDVYTKKEAATKTELKALKASDIGAAPEKHEHSYMQFKSTPAELPYSAYMRSAIYANGRFVAVGHPRSAFYSEDGINWSASILPSISDWRSITYGNDKFIAISFSPNTAAYSEDGINWLESTLPSAGSYKAVVYGNGKFISVGNGAEIAYSEDGITWNTYTSPSHYYDSVVYGNDMFVAISGSYNTAVYSRDGINWYAVDLPHKEQWEQWNTHYITYGNGKFVAIEADSTRAIYSVDGINWSKAELPVRSCRSVTYGDGKFVAVSTTYKMFAYSSDGIMWDTTPMPESSNCGSVAYGDGKFVALGHDTNSVAFSKDGIHWKTELNEVYQDGKNIIPDCLNYATNSYVESVKSEIDISLNGLAPIEHEHSCLRFKNTLSTTGVWNSVACRYYGGVSKYVAVGNNGCFAHSDDGINWTELRMPTNDNWVSVVSGTQIGANFVAVSDSGNIAYSSTGVHWYTPYFSGEFDLKSDEGFRFVEYNAGQGLYLAVSNSFVAYSSNGDSWSKSALPTDYTCNAGAGRYTCHLYVSHSDQALASYNGYSSSSSSWYYVTMPRNQVWTSIVCGKNDRFVAVGNSEYAAYSDNGSDWVETRMPGNYNWKSVVYDSHNKKYVAIASNYNKAAYSDDGITWYEITLPNSHPWISISNSPLVAIAQNGTVIRARNDGITWEYAPTKLVQDDEVVTLEQLGIATAQQINQAITGAIGGSY